MYLAKHSDLGQVYKVRERNKYAGSLVQYRESWEER
jgi:hypothetical protein